MNSREVGLVLGSMFGKHFFQSDDLHYGYWPGDLPVCLANLKQAQENHSRHILARIPEGVETVLDVGCGTGALARRMIDAGYRVEGVSPSGLLTDRVQALLGESFRVHECRFEDFSPERAYDLVLFSESFQYVRLPQGLENVCRCLAPGGHLLICDFFKTGAEGKSPIGGGHRWAEFSSLAARFPLELMHDEDITRQTAPNYDLVDTFLDEVGRPARDLLFRYGETNRPLLTRLLKRVFRRKLEKMERKYFSGKRTADAFSTYKTYRLMRWRYTGEA